MNYLGLRTLRAVLGTSLPTVFDTLCIQTTTNRMVTDTRQVFYTTAANQYNRVFLEIMAFTTDIDW